VAGWLPLFAPQFLNPLDSNRSVINLSYLNEFNYGLINAYSAGDGSTVFVGNDFLQSGKTWNQVIDTDGWPNDPAVSGTEFGGSIRVPASADYTDKYVITWPGDCEVRFTAGTWTEDVGASSNYTRVSNGRYTNTPGSTPYIVVTLTGLATPSLIGVRFMSTDPAAAGRYLTGFKFYRLGDEARMHSGKFFRVGFLDPLATLSPGAIRFLNWHGGNTCKNTRWENRSQPFLSNNGIGYGGRSNYVASPPYGSTTQPTINQYELAAVSTGAKQTPGSDYHGEVVTCRVPQASGRTGGGWLTVTGITKAASAEFTVAGHPYQTGDYVIHAVTSGMTAFDQRPLQITKTGADTYTVPVNSAAFPNFTSAQALAYASLKVGTRDAYPIAFLNGRIYLNNYGDGYMPAAGGSFNCYKTFYFDKTITLTKDSSGNPIFGVWMFNFTDGGGHSGDVPVEICTALINEVNERASALGYSNPIHMWLCMPHMGLLSMDPDYTIGSNYAVNAVDRILNGGGGFAGLSLPASLIVEFSNEVWNAPNDDFSQSFYLSKKGLDRWGSGLTDLGDRASMSALRSTCMVRDIKAALGDNPRVKFTLGAQGFIGYSAANQSRAEGTTAYLTDTLVTSGSWGTPISNHDAMNHGQYFDAAVSNGQGYMGPGKGTGTFWDDAAMYNGQDNTANGGGNYSGAADQTQAMTNFVNQIVTGVGTQSTNDYTNPSSPTAGRDHSFASAMAGFGKASIHYEGAQDWRCVPYSVEARNDWDSIQLTTAQANFKRAVINSSQWATALVNYFNATQLVTNSYLPAAYYITNNRDGSGAVLDQRWAFSTPDTYGQSGTEGGGLAANPAWVAMGNRNRALSV
jgi:hypothetical protein